MEIRCLFPELGVMVAHALTVTIDSISPGKLDASRIPELLRAINEAPKPVVLVIKAVGPSPARSCVIGDVMTAEAIRVGAVGVITDGGIRDLRGIRTAGFHVFAAGIVPSDGSFSIKAINIPVIISGVEICSGDLIHGDENGVIKIPWDCVAELPDVARKVLMQEKEERDFANSPDFDIEKLKQWY